MITFFNGGGFSFANCNFIEFAKTALKDKKHNIEQNTRHKELK
ncbi:hypothetical protein CUPS4256_09245 [Campylobacter upsaliensis]|nr:hypothetical protein [Campylobacter upsaliensis]